MTARSELGKIPVRVAITGVSGDVGMGAIAGLRAGSIPCWILGLDYGQDCAGFHMCDAYETVKPAAQPDYIRDLEKILILNKIELLMCGVDSEVAILSESRSRLEEHTKSVVVVGEYSLVRQFTDKLKTARLLDHHGLHPPSTWDAADNVAIADISNHLPLIAKPRHGNAAKGVELLSTPDDLQRFLKVRPDNFCIQEFIVGPEYTCGLLFDKARVLRDWICAERVLHDGRTVEARIVKDRSLDAFIQFFASKLAFEGPMNLQLRLDTDRRPRVFEVNPRLSGSTSMRVAVGFNDPARIVRHWLLNEPISRAHVSYSTVHRYFTEPVVMSTTDQVHD